MFHNEMKAAVALISSFLLIFLIEFIVICLLAIYGIFSEQSVSLPFLFDFVFMGDQNSLFSVQPHYMNLGIVAISVSCVIASIVFLRTKCTHE